MQDVVKQLAVEIERVTDEIDAKKRLIKRSVGNRLLIETAEQELKALHTHLSVLEANMAKEKVNS